MAKYRQEVREGCALEPEAERGVIGDGEQRQVEHHLERAVLIGHIRDERRRWALRIERVRLDVAEHDADARQQDQIERDEQRGVADVGVLKAERNESPERGEQVQAKHGPPLVNPERNQAVRQMIAAAAHRTAAGQPPCHADERRVEDGTSRMNRGIAATGATPALRPGAASSAALPRNNPRKRAPLSPMKIEAGRAL